MRKGEPVNGFSAIRSEGGILPSEFLHTLSGLAAKSQTNADYGLTRSLYIKDEIGRSWRMASDLWRDYREQQVRKDVDTEQLTLHSWFYPLLQNVLGYHDIAPCQPVTVGGRQFPIGHSAWGEAVPLVLATHRFHLDEAHTLFGEEGRRRAPHNMLQEYLNAAESCLWGIVSNGSTIRVLRDNPSLTRPAYIEADFERIFEEQLFPDFAAFWLIFHASRFAPRQGDPARCILEGWYQDSIETGQRAREKLSLGVTDALRELGNGFLQHPANEPLRKALESGELSDMAYFQELLRLVYRFLFLFTAEDRRLLLMPEASEGAKRLYQEGYSLARLRERALKRRHYDAYTDLWAGLQITFRGLTEGAPAIALPALGGLFDPGQCPYLDACGIENARLLRAIRSLAYFRSEKVLMRVNFHDMGTEELGSVYESLLELQPQVEVGSWKFRFLNDRQKEQQRGSERKQTGSYYTPPALVGELLKSTLIPVIDRTLRENAQAPKQGLLKLKIVDPACGSGHFLLAAARRLAAEIARLDAGPDTPSEQLRQHALREVVWHCIYGVDRNPLAVELCKAALWIETVEPGKPLSFLDAHIRCGNSLVGVLDPAIMKEGIPDQAFKALTGDDKPVCQALIKRNRQGRGGAIQGNLFDQGSLREAAATAISLDTMPEETLDDIKAKRTAWKQAEHDPAHRQERLKADLFVGAFFAPKTRETVDLVPINEDLNRILHSLTPRPGIEQAVDKLAKAHQFFHWHLAFPEVVVQGGFDVVLGNPPWEVSQLSEEEYFSAYAPSIARLKGSKRKEAIAQLQKGNPKLWAKYVVDKRNSEAENEFIRISNRFQLTAKGKLNTYALFSELFYRLKSESGRAGIIVPSGIATDDSTKAFFEEMAGSLQLVSLYDFENRERIFPAVDSRQKFCLLTLGSGALRTRFMFFATNVGHLADEQRRFTLSEKDIQLINPNTRTCPVFRSSIDAELTKKIYRRVPVLIDEKKGEAGNPWGITFRQGLFNMTSDSHLFRTVEALREAGARQKGGNWITGNEEVWAPLYEAKMIHQYDHRWATYDLDSETSRDVTEIEKADGGFQVLPRYWIRQEEVDGRLIKCDRDGNVTWNWEKDWLLGWRDITNATNERTVIAGVLPRVGVGHNMSLFFTSSNIEPLLSAMLLTNLSTLVFDFFARHKVGGTHLSFFLIKQLPVLPPSLYDILDTEFIVPRLLELSYITTDLSPFAQDLGFLGPPFKYDIDRRAVLRAELDAYFARLYGLTRDELRYILDPADVYGENFPSETFRVLKNNEIKQFGEYRTQRLVLEAWDRLEKTQPQVVKEVRAQWGA